MGETPRGCPNRDVLKIIPRKLGAEIAFTKKFGGQQGKILITGIVSIK
jgi:hypothetical protein